MTTLSEKMQIVESAQNDIKKALSVMTDIFYNRKDSDDYLAVNKLLESAKLNIEGGLL